MEAKIERKVYGKKSYLNVIDTTFKQLVPKTPVVQETQLIDVSTFFQQYDNLFYDIPLSENNNSHLELVNRSSDYLGISLTDLEEEIKNLREENVLLKKQLLTLTETIKFNTQE